MGKRADGGGSWYHGNILPLSASLIVTAEPGDIQCCTLDAQAKLSCVAVTWYNNPTCICKALLFLRVQTLSWVLCLLIPSKCVRVRDHFLLWPKENPANKELVFSQARSAAWASEGSSVPPRPGIAGALGGKSDIRQGGGLQTLLPSCRMGTITDTGCGEDEEVMHVKYHQRLLACLNTLIRSNANSWIVSL